MNRFFFLIGLFVVLMCPTCAEVKFWADSITYDTVLEQLSAEGAVRLESQGHVLSCKKLVYRAKQLTAYDATLVEANGSVIQAKELTCDDTFRDGFFQQVQATLNRENSSIPSHLEASLIRRSEGCTTDVVSASYTPCVLCDTQRPTWRIRSASIHHDQDQQRVTYKHAWLEVKNVPILWAPYFAHPDPSVKRQSGWLFPNGGWSKRLGAWMRAPYFKDLGPHHDMMITPLMMGARPPALGVLYRRNMTRGSMMLGGHLAPNRSNKKENEAQAWHFQGGMRCFLPNDMDRLSFDVQRASRIDDPTRVPFQSLYGRGWSTDLVSQATWLRVSDRYVIRSQALTFQSDNPTFQPVVHPYVTWTSHWPSHGWTWNGSFLSLSRKRTSIDYSSQVQRLSNEIRYRKDWWVRHQNITFMTSNRMDVYATPRAGLMQKMNPYVSMAWRYPLQALSHNGENIWGIQPTVLWATAPRAAKRWFPNEDSSSFTVDDTNFLMANRFQGQVDRFDSTHRVVTGVDHSWQQSHRNSVRVNLFWGVLQPIRYADDHAERLGVARLLIKKGMVQGRCRTLWKRSKALWNEYGAFVDAAKTMVPVTYDVGLIRLGPEIMKANQPLWQLSQQIELTVQRSWTVGCGFVQDLKVPYPYHRRSASQVYSLSYQDDCAKCSFSFYRTPVGVSSTLEDSQASTALDRDAAESIKIPASGMPASNTNVSPYGQLSSSHKMDSGFLFTVTFKDLGSITPNPVALPANPSRLLSRG